MRGESKKLALEDFEKEIVRVRTRRRTKKKNKQVEKGLGFFFFWVDKGFRLVFFF